MRSDPRRLRASFFARNPSCIFPRFCYNKKEHTFDYERGGHEGMRIAKERDLYEKLQILSDAAKYDVACTSSGADRRGNGRVTPAAGPHAQYLQSRDA